MYFLISICLIFIIYLSCEFKFKIQILQIFMISKTLYIIVLYKLPLIEIYFP